MLFGPFDGSSGLSVYCQDGIFSKFKSTKVYLITYSRVDTTKFSSKESFSLAILEAWQHFGIRILHWVVCIEAHSNNNGCASSDNINMNLYHFHMAVKLAKRGRWL